MEFKFLVTESHKKNQEIDYAMKTNLSHTKHLQDFGGMLTGFIIPVLLHLTRLLIWWLVSSPLESYKRRLATNI